VRLDGNAAAGALTHAFGRDLTTCVGTCAGCEAPEAVGAMHLYRGAGLVLRCPHCESVLMRVVHAEARTWIDLRGLVTLDLRT
jgi:hypothetical protein